MVWRKPRRTAYFDQRQAGAKKTLDDLVRDYRRLTAEHGVEDGTLRVSGGLLQTVLRAEAGRVKATGTLCEVLTFAVAELSERREQ